MPIEFNAMLIATRGMSDRELTTKRFVATDQPKGWELVAGSSMAHSVAKPLRKLGDAARARVGDNIERKAHAEQKLNFRNDVRQSICDHYGPALGNTLYSSTGLDKNHWPTPEKIREVSQKAAKEIPRQSLEVLEFVRSTRDMSLVQAKPELAVLDPEQRRQFDAALVEHLTAQGEFRQGSLTNDRAIADADTLIKGRFRPMFEEAKRVKIAAASNQYSAATGSMNYALVGGEGIDAQLAATAVARARSYCADNLDGVDAANVGLSVRDRAYEELTPMLLAPHMDKLRVPGAERDALRAKLGARYSEADVNRLLHSVGKEIVENARKFAPLLARGGMRFIEARVSRLITMEAFSRLRASPQVRDEIKNCLGHAPDEAKLDESLAKMLRKQDDAPDAELLSMMAQDPARAIARHLKYELLLTEGKIGMQDDGATIKQAAGFALGRLLRNGEPLDNLDYAMIASDPAHALRRLAGA